MAKSYYTQHKVQLYSYPGNEYIHVSGHRIGKMITNKMFVQIYSYTNNEYTCVGIMLGKMIIKGAMQQDFDDLIFDFSILPIIQNVWQQTFFLLFNSKECQNIT